jgi:pyridoxine 5-phosphate synthase
VTPLRPNTIRLGVNIDHVATLRNARGGAWPDPAQAAVAARDGGADGITIHLREDRRHIRDADLAPIKAATALPINFEMAATAEMQSIALAFRPHAACIVPEKRTEVTTEGGLDVAGQVEALRPLVAALSAAGIRVSMFIDPDPAQVAASAAVGAGAVELHTGRYCEVSGAARQAELARLQAAARAVAAAGLECHAGHGLSYHSVGPVAAIPEVVELNIGHFLMGAALFEGLAGAVARMRALMAAARVG